MPLPRSATAPVNGASTPTGWQAPCTGSPQRVGTRVLAADRPPPARPAEESLAPAHRRLGEHLHEVEDHLLQVADTVLVGNDEAEALRQRARSLSAEADSELARADDLQGHQPPPPT